MFFRDTRGDRQTNRHADGNSLYPYRRRSKYSRHEQERCRGVDRDGHAQPTFANGVPQIDADPSTGNWGQSGLKLKTTIH